MIEYGTQMLKPEAQVKKNQLYKICGDRTVPISELHDDCQDIEVVHLRYRLKKGQYAILGYEFRPQFISKQGSKSADVMTCLIDDDKKHVYSLVLDIKRNISAFSDDLLKDNAALTAIKEAVGFIEQIHHSKLHKDSLLVYRKDQGYTETEEVGIATRRLEEQKFYGLADFLENLEELPKLKINPQSWFKVQNQYKPYVPEASKIREFAGHKVTICGRQYPLHVYLLEQINESEYAVSIELELS